MGYADKQLTRGEVIDYRTRQHWLAIVVNGRRAWLMLIVGIAVFAIGTLLLKDTAQTGFQYAGAAVTVVALLWIVILIWDWRNEEYLVTSRRVLKVEGIINKRLADSSLEKINDAVVDQNLVGRMFGYADLDIITAAEQAFDRFRMLAHASDFHKAILESKHDLEVEVASSGRLPEAAPAVQAAPSAQPGGTATPYVAASSAEPGMTADEITRAIQGLADLRDRGAISPADFEAKKADLLARL